MRRRTKVVAQQAPKIRRRKKRPSMPIRLLTEGCLLSIIIITCYLLSRRLLVHHESVSTTTFRQLRVPEQQDLIKEQQPSSHFQSLFATTTNPTERSQILASWHQARVLEIQRNLPNTHTWIPSYLLPSYSTDNPKHAKEHFAKFKRFLGIQRSNKRMAWEDETYDEAGLLPKVDYTKPSNYVLPPFQATPPQDYPRLDTLESLMTHWHQDQDHDGIIHEQLQHFDYNDEQQLKVAKEYRDQELPFKLINVPELLAANQKWTDDYLAKQFDQGTSTTKRANGNAQESTHNFFAFFSPLKWDFLEKGLPFTINNDWTFSQWAKHARYADAVSLDARKPHFYWQAGVEREERHQSSSQQTFISKDLPSWSSTENNFILFDVDQQKGIQCRFGERGVVAATHYDTGRNMVGMITGAKRYILAPPTECGKLGIFPNRESPIFRHSVLNFGHLSYRNETGMSEEERSWLDRAATSKAVETVLKQGEVLYIPSYWFHYIISVQKSAQCNVRSGASDEVNPRFGGLETVLECKE